MTNPKQQNYFMPPEWYPHECCWMQWPHEFQNKNSYQEVESWSHFDFEKGRHKWAEVALGISNFQKVNMIVHPQDIEIAKKLLDANATKKPARKPKKRKVTKSKATK